MTAPTAPWGARGLAAGYGDPLVLADVDLDLVPGRVVAVVGGDGSGKTTLLRCLAGALQPRAGRLRLPPPQRVGVVSEGPGVYPDLTVAENLAFAARAYGLDAARLRRRRAELLAATGLEAAVDRLAAALSGGMRQKLAFATAAVHEPALLLLDEATTGVDPVSRRDLFRLIARAAAGGTAVVFSTSYLDEAERAAEVVVLADGRPLLTGSPAAVIARVPGLLVDLTAPPPGPSRAWAWRRGRRWRLWCPAGTAPPPDASAVVPDLEDAVVVAQLAATAEQPRREVVAP